MIDPKKILTNGVFCPMPWTGLMYNFDGSVKNCIRSADKIGNIKDNSIDEILLGEQNLDTQENMLSDLPGKSCHTCYNLENNKKNFNIISDRMFYIKELKQVPLDTYQIGNHDLHTVDVRWSNLCNFSCVYCGPEFSSRWESELKVQTAKPTVEQTEKFKQYIFDSAHKLKHVYLAGGEPLLMKENLEFLELLKRVNPGVNLRINTNLSCVESRVFETIITFPNVHWTVSVETMEEEFEYIRHGGSWHDFLENLSTIKKLDHKITFNMLHFLLNYNSVFGCIDFFLDNGFHPNSFVVGALLGPSYLDIRHLPEHVLTSVQSQLKQRINQHPGYLLEDSYQNLLGYIIRPFAKNLKLSLEKLQQLDNRRNIDSREIFKELYNLV